MTNEITVKRYCAGLYTVGRGHDNQRSYLNTVSVQRFCVAEGDVFNGWIARAEWCRDLYTDPVQTKREAVKYARQMIEEREARKGNRYG